MKVKVEKEIKIIVELTLTELAFIRGMTQNPLTNGEDEKDKSIREGIFTAANYAVNELRK